MFSFIQCPLWQQSSFIEFHIANRKLVWSGFTRLYVTRRHSEKEKDVFALQPRSLMVKSSKLCSESYFFCSFIRKRKKGDRGRPGPIISQTCREMWLLSGPCCLMQCCAWRWVAALYSARWLFDRWRAAWSHSCLHWFPAQFPYLHVILSFYSPVPRDLPLTSQSMNAGENQAPTRCSTSKTSPLAVTSIHGIKLNPHSPSSESHDTRDAQRICRNIKNGGLWLRWSL